MRLLEQIFQVQSYLQKSERMSFNPTSSAILSWNEVHGGSIRRNSNLKSRRSGEINRCSRLCRMALQSSGIPKTGACSPLYSHAVRFTVASMALAFFLVGGAGSAWTEDLTLGLVQSQIRNGMTQGEVAQAIGSPNIASKDRDGNEVWIYDKISTETKIESEGDTKEKSSGFAVGGGGLLGGLAGILGGFSSNQGNRSTKAKAKVETTKKTLTVVIKFDAKHLVKETNYQMSKF